MGSFSADRIVYDGTVRYGEIHVLGPGFPTNMPIPR